MSKLKLCIPVFNNYESCLKLIWTAELNTIKPEEYLIVDNGGGFKDFFKKSELQRLDNVRIHTPQKNLGVAGSWNWFLMDSPNNLLISNDNILFSPNIIEFFLNIKKKEFNPNVVMYSTGNESFDLFMTDKSILMKVGKFDENFYFSYFENNDYIYRMKMLGYINKEVFPVGHRQFYHEVNATTKNSDPIKDADFFEANKQYFIKKWGGEPHHEVYQTPFNIGEVLK